MKSSVWSGMSSETISALLSENWQRLHWCHPGLWGWSAGGGPQFGPHLIQPILHESFVEGKTRTSTGYHERWEVRRLSVHLGFPLLRRSKCVWKNLDAFLALAGELQLNGLQENRTDDFIDETLIEHAGKLKETKPIQNPHTVPRNKRGQEYKPETGILLDDDSGTTSLADLDQKVKSMMEMSENPAPGNSAGKARKCKVCGKEGIMQTINVHIQTNHITGLALPCEMCGKISKSRNGMRYHKLTYHK